MKRLVIDTATRACSVALFDGDACIAAFHEEIGRGHAERLVPMIRDLPENGLADALHVDVGPGSFTGIRVGVSAARALALAWNVPCHGFGCLDLVAAMARHQSRAPVAVDVAMTGGHGEYYFQPFDADGKAIDTPLSLPPAEAAARSHAALVAGDVAELLVAARSGGKALPCLPDARTWNLLSHLAPLPPSPLYVRGPDAKPIGAAA